MDNYVSTPPAPGDEPANPAGQSVEIDVSGIDCVEIFEAP